MKKVVSIGVIIVLVGLAYIMMTLVMPTISGITQDTADAMETSHNMTAYAGTSETMGATPWILWFIPGGIGIYAIIIALRQH